MTNATNLTQLSLSDAVDGLKAKQFSSREITQAFLSEIEHGDGETLHRWTQPCPTATTRAKSADTSMWSR